MKSFAWAAILFLLIAIALNIVGLILIRRTWDNPQQRCNSIIWIYVATFFIIIGGVLAGIAAEKNPDVCALPYSGKLAQYVE